jgi:hypothetical protein
MPQSTTEVQLPPITDSDVAREIGSMHFTIMRLQKLVAELQQQVELLTSDNPKDTMPLNGKVTEAFRKA